MTEEKALEAIAKSLSLIATDLRAIREHVTGKRVKSQRGAPPPFMPGFGVRAPDAPRRRP